MKRVAVVTGGGGGIGKAVAEALSADGWNVVVAGRTVSSLQAVVDGFSTEGLAQQADVSIATEVEQLFGQTIETFGQVDFLFNNAGVAAPAVQVDELSLEDWEKVVSINVSGAFYCARAAFTEMKKRGAGGRIVNNGSVSATTPRLYSAPYTSSKHAITGLTKSLALDGRQFGISCGQINLGNVSSEMGDQMAQGVLQPDGSTMAEPTIAVDHVAEAVMYMANLPADANVLSMTLMANGMPFVGRG